VSDGAAALTGMRVMPLWQPVVVNSAGPICICTAAEQPPMPSLQLILSQSAAGTLEIPFEEIQPVEGTKFCSLVGWSMPLRWRQGLGTFARTLEECADTCMQNATCTSAAFRNPAFVEDEENCWLCATGRPTDADPPLPCKDSSGNEETALFLPSSNRACTGVVFKEAEAENVTICEQDGLPRGISAVPADKNTGVMRVADSEWQVKVGQTLDRAGFAWQLMDGRSETSLGACLTWCLEFTDQACNAVEYVILNQDDEDVDYGSRVGDCTLARITFDEDNKDEACKLMDKSTDLAWDHSVVAIVRPDCARSIF
jgi:hypothetical protein